MVNPIKTSTSRFRRKIIRKKQNTRRLFSFRLIAHDHFLSIIEFRWIPNHFVPFFAIGHISWTPIIRCDSDTNALQVRNSTENVKCLAASSAMFSAYLSEWSIHSAQFIEDVDGNTDARWQTTAPANGYQPSRIHHAIVRYFRVKTNGCDEDELQRQSIGIRPIHSEWSDEIARTADTHE